MGTPQLDSALSVDEWFRLELDLFAGADESLTRLRDLARSRFLPPVPFVVTACLRVLSSLPGNATFDAGLGQGSLNLFVAVVGMPGQGKDLLISATNRAVSVAHQGRCLEPIELALGSGEGVAEALQPEEGQSISAPVLFGASELGEVAALMSRTGSTLRGNLLKIYSGNALGFTNRGEKFTVPAHSYTAGLWMGVQPDKAGELLEGQDDGLRHRFVWTEVIDPTLETLDAELLGLDKGSDTEAGSPTVEVPASIISGTPIAFHPEIVRETQEMRLRTLKYGVQGPNAGHRHQTQLKLATGLALLLSVDMVSTDDWARAGVLMEYSTRVQERCLSHLQAQRDQKAAERISQKERAEERVRTDRAARFRQKVLDKLGAGEVSTRTELSQSVRSDQRATMNEVLDSLQQSGLIVGHEGERGQKYVQRNPAYAGPWG